MASEMDVRIEELDRHRITYFIDHPSSSNGDYARDIREKASLLIQAGPVPIPHSFHILHIMITIALGNTATDRKE